MKINSDHQLVLFHGITMNINNHGLFHKIKNGGLKHGGKDHNSLEPIMELTLTQLLFLNHLLLLDLLKLQIHLKTCKIKHGPKDGGRDQSSLELTTELIHIQLLFQTHLLPQDLLKLLVIQSALHQAALNTSNQK